MTVPLMKNMPAGSFWVLKFSIYKEISEYSQTERVKIRFQEINFVKNIYEVEVLFWTFGVSSILILLWR